MRLLVALATMAALLVTGSVAVSTASTHLEGADSIELILGTDDNGAPFNGFVYGPVGLNEPQEIEIDKSACTVLADTLNGPIMNVSATSVDKKGNDVDPAPIGLVEDGLGVNVSGRGNGQDCGRVDELANGNTEVLTLTLGDGVTGRLIQSVFFDFEAKYDADVKVEYLLGTDSEDEPITIFTENYPLTEGSDSGPDAKDGDKYRFSAPRDEMNIGRLFDGVRISMITGGVSLEGGATHPEPKDNRTVFNLLPALACGESATDGGAGLTDTPRAAFYVGPHKLNSECAVPINISTTNVAGGEQTVIVEPPAGFSWTGVTGVVTIEWDKETPDDDPIDRTFQRLDPGGDDEEDITIPWCQEEVGIALDPASDWMYKLSPDALYEDATNGGDVCLIKQTTVTFDYDVDEDGTIETGEVVTQTTEVYYIWNDPMWVRK